MPETFSVIQAFQLSYGLLQATISIDIKRYPHVIMPHQILECLEIHSRPCLIPAVGMATDIMSDVWYVHPRISLYRLTM